MRALFNHGKDPSMGEKVLGPIAAIRDTEDGPVADVPLLDTSYNRDLLPGLKAGVYGSSFRFKVLREDYVPKPGKSSGNPRGLPERTITEARLFELGPVTFPAYAGATAGVRSLTDRFRLADLRPEEIAALKDRMDTEDLATLAEMIQLGASYIEDQDEPEDQKNVPVMENALAILASLVPVEVADTEPLEPDDQEASSSTGTDVQERETETPAETIELSAPPHPELPRRGTQSEPTNNGRKAMSESIEQMRARQDEIRRELEEIAADFTGHVLDASAGARWDDLTGEVDDLSTRIAETEKREAYLRDRFDKDSVDAPDISPERRGEGTGVYVSKRQARDKTPENVFDMGAYHGQARDQGQLLDLYRDGARRALETFHYPHPDGDEAKINGHIEGLLNTVDSPTKEFARRVLTCGSETYRRAFWKTMTNQSLTNDEQRAFSQAQMETRTEAIGLSTGGGIAPIPIQVDPTVILTSNGVQNPIRQLASVETTTSYIWQGVTSGGVVAQYQAEAVTMLNNAGTMIAPVIQPERVTSFIPFSWEVGQDWGSLESALAIQVQDAKDQLEATKFALGAGHGSNEPRGILIGAGTVIATSSGTTGTGFALTDVYLVENALPPRYLPNAKWVASVGVFQKIRGFGSSLGPQAWADSLIVGNPPTLLGYPAYKCSTIGTSISAGYVAGAIWGVFGDWSRYKIIDRLGMSIRVIPDLFGGTAGIHFPTGQSGLVAYWRNSADVLDSNGFRVGTISKGVN